MLRLFFNLSILSLVMLVSSCFKEDQAVTPHKPGNYVTDTVALSDTYKYQVYYNLHDSLSLGTVLKSSWDLGFECSPSGWRVILNSASFMKSAYLEGQAFGAPADTVGAKWIFNPSDGSADSLAVGKWFTVTGNDTIGTNRLLVIDRGMDEVGEPLGFCQLVIDSLVNGNYFFRIAAMDGKNPKSYAVKKKSGYNHALFSITNPASTVSEPGNTSWDLLFSQYTTLLFTDEGEAYPYLVTGVLINSNFVEVAVDSVTPFADINFEKAQQMNFSRQTDRIGYDWKKYNFTSGTYTVESDINYVIRDTKGFLYKFRFIGFYKFLNRRLQKGYPSFEYQKL